MAGAERSLREALGQHGGVIYNCARVPSLLAVTCMRLELGACLQPSTPHPPCSPLPTCSLPRRSCWSSAWCTRRSGRRMVTCLTSLGRRARAACRWSPLLSRQERAAAQQPPWRQCRPAPDCSLCVLTVGVEPQLLLLLPVPTPVWPQTRAPSKAGPGASSGRQAPL